jgi:3-hydroxyisobutyrate dehydrogenase-like beta-hydroxyacid dehydrogenase
LSPAEAIAASPLTVICTIDKAATAGLLQAEGVSAALRGRTIAELSTGTPTEARANAKLVSTAGGRYLDGGIMGYPRDIGRADGLIVYSGNRSAFDEYGPTLATLAGAQRYLGEDEGAAATVYLALWAYYFPAVSSFFEGAALAQTAGVSLVDFQKLAAVMNDKLEDGLDDSVRRIAAHNYAGDQAPVDTYVEGLYIVRNAFLAKRLNHVSVDAFINHLEQIQRAGNGDKDIAILFRTLGGKD